MAPQPEPKRVSRISVWVKGVKAGVATDGDFTVSSNDEDAVTDDGWNSTDGTPISKLSLNTINTVDGDTKLLADVMDGKVYVVVQVGPIDGEMQTFKGRCTERKYAWKNDKGSATGAFNFSGGQPTRS